MTPLQPGEWSDSSDEISADPYENKDKRKEKPNYVPHTSERLVKVYRSIVDALKLKPEIVYYPCCEIDVSPSAAFSDSRVVYLDMNEDAMNSLQKHGHETHVASAQEFQLPGGADVLILLNPQIDPDFVTRQVKIGGHVICNNYHDTAAEMGRLPNFRQVATALRIGQKNVTIDTQHPEDYLIPVANDGEFEMIAPETFAIAQTLRGDAASVLEGYDIFLKDGILFWGRVLKNGTEYSPVPTRKHADVDDFFVFQKLAATQPEA